MSFRFLKEFTVKRIIGEGGYGSVFEAINVYDKQSYAIKRIAVDSQYAIYVRNCKNKMTKKRVQLCNYSLSKWLKEHELPSSRSLPRMKSWFKQIVSAVDYIHNKNLIHRDLKVTSTTSLIIFHIRIKYFQPSNILFAETDLLKICDLGIAIERLEEDETETTILRSFGGTIMYTSPEQVRYFS